MGTGEPVVGHAFHAVPPGSRPLDGVHPSGVSGSPHVYRGERSGGSRALGGPSVRVALSVARVLPFFPGGFRSGRAAGRGSVGGEGVS